MTHTNQRGAWRSLRRGLATLTLALGGLALAGGAQAQMAGTGHDLTDGTEGREGALGEICVYCHTPHGGDTDAAAPLWNRTMTDSITERYSALGTVTLQGEEAPVGSVSLACLSCHDGTQAMDTVINAPGRGLGDTGDSTFVMDNSAEGVSNDIAMRGTDLRDDHPISIQFCGGGITSTGGATTGTCNDPDYNTPEFDTINGNDVWWVDVDATAGRQRTDIFLYTRTDFSGGAAQPAVECGSCHDPHVASANTAAEVHFMRTSNANSAVCLACHNK
ncbi:hypothetical protein DU490_13015 [Halomonas sp. DQ26W]|uniref:hypothetical protein n=1 Tax=Halomonas sp. DQ26W TaxID=2282311 RepID=UPI000DF7275A|nr:hypothetical protein [Halomonas sp. DQ26W]RDB42450.1 hypothetical protein DU490_13015 [Halomonas sp. DQ26W]